MREIKPHKLATTNPDPTEMLAEVYQFQLRMSSGKSHPLPSITKIAEMAGVSRTTVYDWAKGKIGCRRVADLMKDLTGIPLPVKIQGQIVYALEALLRIRRCPERYTL